MKKKTAKPTIRKAHRIADRLKRSRRRGSQRVRNPYAVGMAAAKKAAAKRRRARARSSKRRRARA